MIVGLRREIAAAAVLIAVVVLVVGFFGPKDGSIDEGVLQERRSLGEWMTLDNDARVNMQRENGISEKMVDPHPFGMYSGVLEMKIDGATMWNSPESAGISTEDIQLSAYKNWPEDFSFCEIAYTIRNVSANPCPGSSKSGHVGFNNSYLLFLEGVGHHEAIYFDGMIENGNLESGDGNIFFLEPGEERSFVSGFAVSRPDVPVGVIVGGDVGFFVDLTQEEVGGDS